MAFTYFVAYTAGTDKGRKEGRVDGNAFMTMNRALSSADDIERMRDAIRDLSRKVHSTALTWVVITFIMPLESTKEENDG